MTANLTTGPKCLECERGRLVPFTRDEELDYDLGEETIKVLTRDVPVERCDSCGMIASGPAAAKVRHEAVCRAAGLLTPSEIKGLRERFGWSQQYLADLTDFGVATISRWERGRLLPNRSNNKVPASHSRLPTVSGVPRWTARGEIAEAGTRPSLFQPGLSARQAGSLRRCSGHQLRGSQHELSEANRVRHHLLLVQRRRRPHDGPRQRRRRVWCAGAGKCWSSISTSKRRGWKRTSTCVRRSRIPASSSTSRSSGERGSAEPARLHLRNETDRQEGRPAVGDAGRAARPGLSHRPGEPRLATALQGGRRFPSL